MSRAWHLGNDVVDLTSPRSRDRSPRPRFLQRVLHPEEAALLASSPAPHRTLWLLWAGKEALFKSATKALGSPPVFNHPRFRIRFAPHELSALPPSASPGPHEALLRGAGEYEDFSFGLRARVTRDHIHALAWVEGPEEGGIGEPGGRAGPEVLWQVDRRTDAGLVSVGTEGLKSRFTDLEWACVSHRASALTRLAARGALAEALAVEEGRLEIRCGPGDPGRRVPLAFLDQNPIPVDLSLSHDGPVMAWAFLAGR